MSIKNLKISLLLISFVFTLTLISPPLASAADSTTWTYHNDDLHYSIKLPNTFEQVPSSVMKVLYTASNEVTGFHLKNLPYGNSPYIYVAHANKEDSEFSYLTLNFENYKKDPTNTKKKMIEDYNNSLKDINATVMNMEIHPNQQYIYYEYKFQTKSGYNYMRFKFQKLDPNGVEIFNFDIINENQNTLLKQSNDYRSVFQSIYQSFQYDPLKIISLTLSQDLDKQNLVANHPTAVFNNHTGNLYALMQFNYSSTEKITAKWYHIENGKKNLKASNTNQYLDFVHLWFSYSNKSFETGNWILEITSDSIHESVPFTVTSDPNPKSINIYINGIQKVFDIQPQIIHDRTFVPLRGIFESLGANINWNNKTQTVTATKDNTNVQLTINQDTALVNGALIKLADKAQIMHGHTMVPLRFVSEALGSQVKWNGDTNSINILDNTKTEVNSSNIKSVLYHNSQFKYSFQLPGSMEQASDAYQQHMTSQRSDFVTAFQLKGTADESFPFISILHRKKDDPIYQLYTQTFASYTKNANSATQIFLQQLQESFKSYQPFIYDLQIDPQNNMIMYKQDYINVNNVRVIQTTYAKISNNGVEVINFFMNKENEKTSQPLFDLVMKSFQFDK